MKRLRKHNGYTLAEVITVTGVMTIVVACVLSMMLGAMTEFDKSASKSYTDDDAVIAMQMIVGEVREAKSFQILANGERLRVVKPVRIEGTTEYGYYNRYEPDTQGQFDYYISDETGTPGHAGTWLWEGKDNNNRHVLLKRNVKSLHFEPDTQWSVIITVVTEHDSSAGPVETRLTQRVVYLRNH